METETKQYIVGGIIIFIVILSLYFGNNFKQGTLSTVPIFNEAEPKTIAECQSYGGILIDIKQQCTEPYSVEYGFGQYTPAADIYGTWKCCIQNYCEVTGGKWETNFNKDTLRFETKCYCPLPKQYDIKVGCAQKYG
jgi:hypothetical protein